jgi:hypothetical protein
VIEAENNLADAKAQYRAGIEPIISAFKSRNWVFLDNVYNRKNGVLVHRDLYNHSDWEQFYAHFDEHLSVWVIEIRNPEDRRCDWSNEFTEL